MLIAGQQAWFLEKRPVRAIRALERKEINNGKQLGPLPSADLARNSRKLCVRLELITQRTASRPSQFENLVPHNSTY